MRPEGVYEIVDANTERSKKRIGRWCVFPFSIKVGERLNVLHTKQNNPIEYWGKWLSTSLVEDIIDRGDDFIVVTKNTEYTFERVL